MDIKQEIIDFANKYGKDNGHAKMHINDKGEVFTSHNLAMLSVDHDPKRIATVNIDPVVAIVGEDEAGDTTPANNGEGTAETNTSTSTEAGSGTPAGDQGTRTAPKAAASTGVSKK